MKEKSRVARGLRENGFQLHASIIDSTWSPLRMLTSKHQQLRHVQHRQAQAVQGFGEEKGALAHALHDATSFGSKMRV